MAKSLWRKNGTAAVIVDSDGKPIWCEQCPCGPSCCDLQDAILERQKAYGITSSWAPGDPTNTSRQIATCAQKSDYTIQEYRDYINHIAPTFLDGTYSGGASEPTMLTSSYADAGTDCGELYVLVQDMETTKLAGSEFDLINGEIMRGQDDQFVTEGQDFDAAYAAAKSNASANYSGSLVPYSGDWQGAEGMVVWDASYEEVLVYLEATTITMEVASLSTELSKTVRFFVQPLLGTQGQWSWQVPASDVAETFDKHGRTLPSQDQYGLHSSHSIGADSTVVSDPLGGLNEPGVTKTGGGASDDGLDRNWELSIDNNTFALIDWGFSA